MDVKEALEWADGYCSKDKERKAEVGTLAAEVRRLRKGEYICQRCGLRKNDEHEKGDF